MVAALATFLKNPESLDSVVSVAGSLNDSPLGDQMGLEAELVIARKLEDNWERPLLEWKQELRLP